MKPILKTLAIGAILATGFAQGADATVLHFYGNLSGAAESPPNASPGTGIANVFWDTTGQTMEVQVTFAGLLGTTTASHIHCCLTTPFTGTAGVATTTPTFTGFPLGVTSGSYDHIFDMTLASSYNPSFVTAQGSVGAAEAALLNGLENGLTYLNIHTTFAPGGEIRAFLRVPEPGSLELMLGGLVLGGAVLFGARRTKRA